MDFFLKIEEERILLYFFSVFCGVCQPAGIPLLQRDSIQKGASAMAVTIKAIAQGSHAMRHGIQCGEKLVSINGHTIMDVLDYRFYQMERELALVLEDTAGRQRKLYLKKPVYDEIGLLFETYLMDRQHTCRNKCIFCFIDQLPKGMRESLYFKDDDSRLSFLFGNYITLTNLTRHEIDRIIQMHISPINVSVHTTNPQLRVKMMNNRFAGRALSVLEQFAQAGIKINCQIVACPGINDGKELDKTLADLAAFYPAVESVAIVPVGLTRYREGLYPLEAYTKETAQQTLAQIEQFGDVCRKKYGVRIAFASDEFYLQAGRQIPPAEFYEDFSQLENGVGLLALLQDQFLTALREKTCDCNLKREVTVASGTASAPFLQKLFLQMQKKFPGVSVSVVAIENRFFGGGVNVSGLVTGTDLISQLKGRNLGDALLIPSVMLCRQGDVFLDDVSVQDVKRQLATALMAVPNEGGALLNAVLGTEKQA